MKKVIALLAIMAMTTTGMSAQENQGQRPPRMNKEEMVQQRTDYMAQQYGLDDAQKQQLLELNKKYADDIPMMGPRPGGPRGGGPGGQMRRQGPPQGGEGNGSFQPGQRPGMGQGQGFGRPRFDPEKMKEYETGLSQIMTKEQYEKYESEKKARMERMRQRRSE